MWLLHVLLLFTVHVLLLFCVQLPIAAVAAGANAVAFASTIMCAGVLQKTLLLLLLPLVLLLLQMHVLQQLVGLLLYWAKNTHTHNTVYVLLPTLACFHNLYGYSQLYTVLV